MVKNLLPLNLFFFPSERSFTQTLLKKDLHFILCCLYGDEVVLPILLRMVGDATEETVFILARKKNLMQVQTTEAQDMLKAVVRIFIL